MGVFCHEGIEIQLRDAVDNFAQEAITLDAGGTVAREVFSRAKEALYVEGKLTNYFHVDATFTLKKGSLIGVDGYVFNSSKHFWEADQMYKCTAEKSRIYLKSFFHGHYPSGTSWTAAKDIPSNMHFVKHLDDGTWECDCKAFWHSVECSHVQAAMHLKGEVNIEQELMKISNGKRVGRRNKSEAAPIDLTTHIIRPATSASEIAASHYIGTKIARRLNPEYHPNASRVYYGRVSGKFNMFSGVCCK